MGKNILGRSNPLVARRTIRPNLKGYARRHRGGAGPNLPNWCQRGGRQFERPELRGLGKRVLNTLGVGKTDTIKSREGFQGSGGKFSLLKTTKPKTPTD